MIFGSQMFKFLCKNLHQLRVSVGASKSFGTRVPKSSTSDDNKLLFTVNYLKNVLGFSPEKALSAAKYTKFETSEKPNHVISFFKTYGFTTTQIVRIYKTQPQLLLCDPEKTLLPKIEFFQSFGFSDAKIIAMLSASPDILKRSLEKTIVPNLECINGIVQSHEKVLNCLKRSGGILMAHLDNVKCLKDVGVPQSNIAYLLTYQPRTFQVGHSTFSGIIEKVQGMGFSPLKVNFVVAVHAVRSMNKSNWEKKLEVYKKWGFSEDEILQAFVKHPWCMMASGDKIMAAMELLVDKLGFAPSDVLRQPVIICFSLQNRIIPRSIIYQALSKKGLVPKDFSLVVFLKASEKQFLLKFVECFQVDAPELLTLYQKALPLST